MAKEGFAKLITHEALYQKYGMPKVYYGGETAFTKYGC